MFDWLSLFKKNTDKNVCNNSRIIYSEEAKFLIDKWMKLNGIEGISFDEYIKQLGLDYIDIINLEATNLNLSSPIWKDENFIGVLSFKSESILSGYDERFDLDGKNGSFVPTLKTLNKNMDITNTIYLYKNSLSAQISLVRRNNGLRFNHKIKKDFVLDQDNNLSEIKDVVNINSDELYYDNPRYQYEKTISEEKTYIRVDNLRDNTAFNINIDGNVIDIDDVKLKSILWYPDGELHLMLYNILSVISIDGEFTLKLDLVPGFSNIVYIKDKDGNITIKESNKKSKIYFTLENIQEENTFTKRLTVVCDKRKINLDIVSTKEISIKNLNVLVDYIYSKYNGIFSINECFDKISSLSFSDPDDSLIQVVLTEEYNDRIMNSKVWSRKYYFDRDYTIDDSSIVLRK